MLMSVDEHKHIKRNQNVIKISTRCDRLSKLCSISFDDDSFNHRELISSFCFSVIISKDFIIYVTNPYFMLQLHYYQLKGSWNMLPKSEVHPSVYDSIFSECHHIKSKIYVDCNAIVIIFLNGPSALCPGAFHVHLLKQNRIDINYKLRIYVSDMSPVFSRFYIFLWCCGEGHVKISIWICLFLQPVESCHLYWLISLASV